MKTGIYNIEDAIYNSPAIKKKYIRGNTCLLAYAVKDIIVNGTRYRRTIGFSVEPKKHIIEIAYETGRRVSVKLNNIVNEVTVKREGQVYDISIK